VTFDWTGFATRVRRDRNEILADRPSVRRSVTRSDDRRAVAAQRSGLALDGAGGGCLA